MGAKELACAGARRDRKLTVNVQDMVLAKALAYLQIEVQIVYRVQLLGKLKRKILAHTAGHKCSRGDELVENTHEEAKASSP
jgi:hypothetical protein